MQKKVLLAELEKRSGIDKTSCDAVCNALFKLIIDTLDKEEKMSIRGLGTFRVSMLKERNGVFNGKKWSYEKKKVIKFKSMSSIEQWLNRENDTLAR